VIPYGSLFSSISVYIFLVYVVLFNSLNYSLFSSIILLLLTVTQIILVQTNHFLSFHFIEVPCKVTYYLA
jgi:hypothetical protein